jgi:hypothetical protein
MLTPIMHDLKNQTFITAWQRLAVKNMMQLPERQDMNMASYFTAENHLFRIHNVVLPYRQKSTIDYRPTNDCSITLFSRNS